MWSEIVVAFVGAFFGAGAAMIFARLDASNTQKRNELAAVNALVGFMSTMRSLSISAQSNRPSTHREREKEWSRSAVMSLRSRVRETHFAITASTGLSQGLLRMVTLCNDYIELQELTESDHPELLVALSQQLDDSIRGLGKINKNVVVLSPGSNALSAAETTPLVRATGAQL